MKLFKNIREAAETFDVDLKWALMKRKEYIRQTLLKKKPSWYFKSDARKRLYIKILLWQLEKNIYFEKEFNLILKKLDMIFYNQEEYINLERKYMMVKEIPLTDFISFNKKNYALCPFHNEKTPSLKYYPKKNNAYCFGCNEYIDIIRYYSKVNKLSKEEAVNELYKKYYGNR